MATKNYIFAVGGQESSKTASKVVERYHVRANIWQSLPPLVEGRFDASTIILGDSLYVFGGVAFNTLGEFIPLKTIERLSLKHSLQAPLSFTPLELRLPFAVANTGVIGVSQSEALILGGFGQSEPSD